MENNHLPWDRFEDYRLKPIPNSNEINEISLFTQEFCAPDRWSVFLNILADNKGQA